VLIIEQAASILVAATGRTEAEAIDMLRQVSKRRNVAVRDLAAWLIAGAGGNTQP
jgi:AmiR/NasT family two-component response regulator